MLFNIEKKFNKNLRVSIEMIEININDIIKA